MFGSRTGCGRVFFFLFLVVLVIPLNNSFALSLSSFTLAFSKLTLGDLYQNNEELDKRRMA
jgi:hypothetical protein